MYFHDRGCVHTLLTLYVYATDSIELDRVISDSYNSGHKWDDVLSLSQSRPISLDNKCY